MATAFTHQDGRSTRNITHFRKFLQVSFLAA